MNMPGQHGPGSHTEDTCYSCYTVTTEALSSFPESFSTSRHKSNSNAKTQEIHTQMRFSPEKGHKESSNKQLQME